MNAVARPAATLVLLRESATGGGPPEVLLVRRQNDAAFGPGASVFPGGAVEPQDGNEEILRTVGTDGAELIRRLSGGDLTPIAALAYPLAALRETFEETLLLLAEPQSGAPWPTVAERESARENLLGGTHPFGDWLRQAGLRPALAGLRYFAHWITPEAMPIRFDTRFFAAAAPRDQAVCLDPNELDAHSWIPAARALDLARKGELFLMPPTQRTLETFAAFDTLASALGGLGHDEVRPIIPRLITGPGGLRTVVIPGDPGYEI
ncbi:MAG: NUDIX hydrolase [Deltaproteobacteria bacterium]|nr:NUDIX hydrolase [Deltaproteobacteria bacterium]